MNKKITITINNKPYKAAPKSTILDICRAQNIFIPTLCKHPDLKIQGRCRICLVEVEGLGMVTSCSTLVADGQKIKTDTPQVKRARAANLEMIFAEHIEKCGKCIAEHNCALKNYAHKYNLKLTRFKDRKGDLPIWHFGKKSDIKLDKKIKETKANFATSDHQLRVAQAEFTADGFIEFDATKCIDCGICTDICRDHQTVDFYETVGKGYETMTKPTDDLTKDCTYCGQCVVHCPVGAIQGVAHWPAVEDLLKNKKKHGKTLIAQIAPSVRVSIGEEFGLDYGTVVTGQLSASIKALGFDFAFDVTTGADFTTYEEARELIFWLLRGKDRPMITSCCPGWVKFVEFYFPDFVPHLTTVRPPEIMSGIIAKTYWADLLHIKAEDILVVSIMPCTAKKNEISLARHSLEISRGKKRIKLPAVDYALTTREFAYLIKRNKINLAKIKPAHMDNPLGFESGAAVIYGASGGVMESALRTADYFLRVKKEVGGVKPLLLGANYQLTSDKFSRLSQNRLEFKETRGLAGRKEAIVKVGGTKLKVAVVNGLSNARQLLNDLKTKKCYYDYVEIMACPGGCVGGGGQPLPATAEIRAKRAAALYSLDEKKVIRSAHENLSLLTVYREYFQGNEELLEELLHCRYNDGGDRGGYLPIDN